MLWGDDDEFVFVDLNIFFVCVFVIYKFGFFIVDLLVVYCYYFLVIFLFVDKLFVNIYFQRNVYCNFFFYDVNNCILYVCVERMDNVGEFVLVLVYCLLYIVCGDLWDDFYLGFLKEFYYVFVVLCDDLFFVCYWCFFVFVCMLFLFLLDDDLENVSWMLLEFVFGDVYIEVDKLNVVEGLLDVKLFCGVNRDGVYFINEGIVE